MDATTKGVVILKRELGKLLESAVTFYQDDKPATVPPEGFRNSYLRFKTEKDNTKRESMAVLVVKHDADNFTGVSGHEFLNSLLADFQDSCTKAVADGVLEYKVLNDSAKLIAEYNDSSRTSNGRKITKETIGTWFVESCTSFVAAAWFAKNPQGKEKTCKKVIEGYSAMFGNFTKYQLVEAFTPAQMVLIKRIIGGITDTESEMVLWIGERIKKYEELKIAQDALVDAI